MSPADHPTAQPDTDSMHDGMLPPAFAGGSVNIVFSADEKFAPFCAVSIQSLIDHANPATCYDIIILERNISDDSKALLCSLADERENVSIRTLNVRERMSRYLLYVHAHYAVETYFRLLIPELLPGYDKMLYLDSDLVVMQDVAELFALDMGDCCIGGAIEVCLLGMWNEMAATDWTQDYLRLLCLKPENLHRYVNAGVLLMNLQAIRALYSSAHMLEYAQSHQFPCCDQDVLNSLFQDCMLTIPAEWNTFAHPQGEYRDRHCAYAPTELYQKSRDALKNPKIIHYLDHTKPWHDPELYLGHHFWEVARKTPFYERIFYRMVLEPSIATSTAAAVQAATEAATKAATESATAMAMSIVQQPFPRQLLNLFFPMGSRGRTFIRKVLAMIRK